VKDGAAALRISVVIPSWRDAENLETLLPAVSQLPGVAETIVVDASPDESAKQLALANGAKFLSWANPNRGEQMNAGASASTGNVLLFHHSDTSLEPSHLESLMHALRDPKIVGGAFYRRFDSRHPHLRWLEKPARYLNQHGGTLYGDQSIFVRRAVFEAIGGFAKIPLMEDVEFSRRLRAAGKITLLDPPVESSARRHLRKGAWRTTIQNGLFIVLYRFGVSPHRLHRWYYGVQRVSKALLLL
jgi:rSAM/selenodomain-associated transferase 2